MITQVSSIYACEINNDPTLISFNTGSHKALVHWVSEDLPLCCPSWASSLIWIVDSGQMTREAFLAVSGLDKPAEMESVRASGTSESPLARGSIAVYSSIILICRSMSNFTLRLRKKWTDNVYIWIQFLIAILKPDMGDMTLWWICHKHTLENLRYQFQRESFM